MLQVEAENHFRMDTLQTEANVSADKTSVVCRQDTCCVSRQDICCVIVSADISQDIPQVFHTQGRPLRGRPCVGNVGGDVLGDVC